MKIGTKLALGFSTIVALAATASVVSFATYARMHGRLEELREDIIPGAIAMAEMRGDATEAAHEVMDYMVSGDAESKEHVQSAVRRLKAAGQRHLEHETHIGEKEKAVAGQLVSKIEKLRSELRELTRLKDQGEGVDELLKKEDEAMHPALAALVGQLEEHKATHVKELAEAEHAVHAAYQFGVWAGLAVTAVIVLLAAVVAFVTTRSILRPIHELHHGSERIGAGELDYRLDIKAGGAIEQLAEEFNRMAAKLSESYAALDQKVTERTAELSASKAELEERVKELTCLYELSGIAGRAEMSIKDILRETAALLPPAWQYPEIAGGRIRYGDQVFQTHDCPAGPWCQSADMLVRGEKVGSVEVCYREARPQGDEGPFFKEERHLINAVAERLGRIIERRKVEQEARQLKAQTEFILGATNTGIDIIDSEFNVRYINPEWQKVYGDPSGRKCYEYFMDRDEVCPGCGAVKALETKETTVTEGILVKENNRPVQVATIPFQGQNGEWLVAEVNADITDRKRMEHELQRLALIAEQAAEGIAAADLDGNLQFVNHAWARMHGYESGAELVGKHLRVSHTDEQMRTEVVPFNATVERQGHNWAEVGHVRRDGATFPTQMSVFVLKDKEGEPYGLAAFAKDITEQKRAETALRESEERYRVLFAGAPEGILVADIETKKFKYANPAIGEMLDYTEEEFRRMGVTDIHPTDALKYALEQFEAQATGAMILAPEVPCRRKDGSVLYADINTTLATIDGRPCNIGFFRDVTERKAAEETIKKTKRDLEEANSGLEAAIKRASQLAEKAAAATVAKSEFLANMSHEIRTPLTAILGYTDLMADPDQPEAERHECLATVRRNGEHLLSLINDILDLSKIEAGKLELLLERCSLPTVVADVVSLMRIRAEQGGISLSAEYAGTLPETILADEARLRQILVNLVGNAVKFTKRGGVRIVAAFLPDGLGGAPAVRVEVIDTGVGIAPNDLKRLGRPFTQADATASRQHSGTGLGLAISGRLADLMGGTFAMESQLGKGSTFGFTIPTGPLDGVDMLEDPSEVLMDRTETDRSGMPAADALSGVRVLLAEDGPDNQRLIAAVLRKAGAEVTVVGNGQLAVAAALAEPFDVILMDMQMPEMDGYDASTLLRDKGCSLPIIALTAHAMTEDRERCLSAGCTDYQSKPIDRSALIAAVARHAGVRGSEPDDNAVKRAKQEGEGGEVIVSEYGDDPDLAEVIDSFVGGLAGHVESMRQALRDERYADLRREAHQLKGAGGSYGYPTLTDAARVLEMIARAGDAVSGRIAIERLEALYEAVVRGRRTCTASQEAEE